MGGVSWSFDAEVIIRVKMLDGYQDELLYCSLEVYRFIALKIGTFY